MGNVDGGEVVAETSIKNVKILGQLTSSDPALPAVLAVLGKANPKNAGDAEVFDNIFIRGNVSNAQILAGYTRLGVPMNPNASIGKVTVNGNWSASSLVAGVQDAPRDGFGQNDVLIPGDTQPRIFATIASIAIKGTATGSGAEGDAFGITSQKLGKLTIAGTKQPLTAGPSNVPLDGVNNDFRAVDFA